MPWKQAPCVASQRLRMREIRPLRRSSSLAAAVSRGAGARLAAGSGAGAGAAGAAGAGSRSPAAAPLAPPLPLVLLVRRRRCCWRGRAAPGSLGGRSLTAAAATAGSAGAPFATTSAPPFSPAVRAPLPLPLPPRPRRPRPPRRRRRLAAASPSSVVRGSLASASTAPSLSLPQPWPSWRRRGRHRLLRHRCRCHRRSRRPSGCARGAARRSCGASAGVRDPRRRGARRRGAPARGCRRRGRGHRRRRRRLRAAARSAVRRARLDVEQGGLCGEARRALDAQPLRRAHVGQPADDLHLVAGAEARHGVGLDEAVRLQHGELELVARRAGRRLGADLVERALGQDLEVLARHVEAADDVERAARLVLQLVQPGAARADQRARDAVLELDPEGLALGLARDAAQVAQHVDRERLVGEHAPGALAGSGTRRS